MLDVGYSYVSFSLIHVRRSCAETPGSSLTDFFKCLDKTSDFLVPAAGSLSVSNASASRRSWLAARLARCPSKDASAAPDSLTALSVAAPGPLDLRLRSSRRSGALRMIAAPKP